MAKASDLDLFRYMAKYDRQINVLFNAFITEMAKCCMTFDNLPKEGIFSFNKYQEGSKKVSDIARKFKKALKEAVLNAVSGSILLAMAHQEEKIGEYSRFSDKVLDDFRGNVEKGFIKNRYESKHGLDLSTRVWNYTEQTKAEFELGLSQVLQDGIRKGESAEEIGRRVRHKLNDPDAMWRRYHYTQVNPDGTKVDKVEWRKRVIDADGKIHFVQQELEHPGRGVYRSARQNALRLTANEINMAYAYTDIMRYQNEPFVLGFHIGLSGHRSDVVEDFHDMCDELVGDYPKWFLWELWHPRCKCILTAILCSKEEMRKIQGLPEEEYRAYKSPNLIKNMPQCYNDYIEANADRIQRSVERGTQPYWIRDNYIDGDPNNGWAHTLNEKPQVEIKAVKTPEERRAAILEAAKKRHASRDAEDIQRRWDIRYINNWKWSKPQFETDGTKFDDDYLKKNLNRVAISSHIGSGVYEESDIEKSSRFWLVNTWEKEAREANASILGMSNKIDLSHTAMKILANDSKTPIAAIGQMRRYLENMDDIEQWNYLQRLNNNMRGAKNLNQLIQKNVDFTKVSTNMPVDLLPNSTTYPMNGRVLDKRLFDNMDYYVPVEYVYGDKTSSNSSGTLSVYLNPQANRGSFEEINVIYHEYGHALDVSHSFYGEKKVDELMDSVHKILRKKVNGTNAYEAIDKYLYDDYWSARRAGNLEQKEKVMTMMDIIQSLTKGKYGQRKIDGHGKASYWKHPHHPHTEFVAHMSECFFIGNDYVKEKNADLYNQMTALFESLFIIR